MSSLHAPRGGISIGGDWYEGGQFMPVEDFTRGSRHRAVNLSELRPGMEVTINGFASKFQGVVIRVQGEYIECRYQDRYTERQESFHRSQVQLT